MQINVMLIKERKHKTLFVKLNINWLRKYCLDLYRQNIFITSCKLNAYEILQIESKDLE